MGNGDGAGVVGISDGRVVGSGDGTGDVGTSEGLYEGTSVGAGVGLSGIFIAHLFKDNLCNNEDSKVIITDLPCAIDGILENIKVNNFVPSSSSISNSKIKAIDLPWGPEFDSQLHSVMAMFGTYRLESKTIKATAKGKRK